MIRAARVLAFAAAALAATPASADPPSVRDADNHYQIDLPKAWQRVEPAAGPETILLAARDGDRTLAVTRIDYPNPERKKKHFHDSVEDGLARAVPGYKRLRKKTRRYGHVYVLDLVFRRDADDAREAVWMRFLFFRTFTLTAAVTAPFGRYRAVDRTTRKLLTTFQPHSADD